MKTINSILLAFLALLMATGIAVGQEQLLIGGKPVPLDKTGNITGNDAIRGGTVSYDHITKTLTLDGASIQSEVIGIESSVSKLTIRAIGSLSSIASRNTISLKHTAPLTIRGAGKLWLGTHEDSQETSILTYQTSLTIENCNVLCGEIAGDAEKKGDTEDR